MKQRISFHPTSAKYEVTYHFASTPKRLLVRTGDHCLLILFLVGWLFLILVYQPHLSISKAWQVFNKQALLSDGLASWRWLLFWTIINLVYWTYFVFLLPFTQGYTVFGKLFKVQLINFTDQLHDIKLKWVQLIKKELVIQLYLLSLSWLFALILLIIAPHKNAFALFLGIFQPLVNQPISLQVVYALFDTLFGFGFFLQLVYFGASCYLSKQMLWQDKFGHLVVIDLRLQVSNNKPLNSKQVQQLRNIARVKLIKNLPGRGIN